MAFTIENWGGDDIIDSREIIDRLEELTDEQADLSRDVEDARDAFASSDDEDADEAKAEHARAIEALEAWEEEHLDELQKLKEIAKQGEGYGDWSYGEVLVRAEYFKEYAQQLAEDIGAINHDLTWPNNHIDWDAAAEDLKADYMEIECDGFTYLMRA